MPSESVETGDPRFLSPWQDPTKLTSDAIDAAKEELRRELTAATILLDERLSHLREVTNEKFSGVDIRFAERDERVAQAAQEATRSLDAALSAAKEAVGEQNKANTESIAKSENATAERIKAGEARSAADFTALDRRMSELKERLDRGEGGNKGTADLTDRLWSRILSITAILISTTATIIIIIHK